MHGKALPQLGPHAGDRVHDVESTPRVQCEGSAETPAQLDLHVMEVGSRYSVEDPTPWVCDETPGNRRS